MNPARCGPVPALPPIAAADGPVFVIAGSLSPVTRRQIEAAAGFTRVPIDAGLLARGDESYLTELIRQVSELMRLRPQRHCPYDAAWRKPSRRNVAGNRDSESHRSSSCPGCCRLLNLAASESQVGIRQAGRYARSMSGACRSLVTSRRGLRSAARTPTSKTLDGIEIMLKGGQMGPPDLFLRLRCGT